MVVRTLVANAAATRYLNTAYGLDRFLVTRRTGEP